MRAGHLAFAAIVLVGLGLGWAATRRESAGRPARPAVIPVSEAPLHVAPGDQARARLLLGPQTQAAGARVHLGQVRIEAGGEMRRHGHAESDELLFIHSGAGELEMGGRVYRLQAPVSVFIPRGVPHSFRASDEQPVEAVQVYDPAGPEQRFTRWRQEP